MNFEETKFWVSELFPGDPQFSEHVTQLPASGRHGQAHEAKPLRIAEFSLFDGSDGHAQERRPETVAATLELGRNYCGLTGAAKTDIRVELFHVGYADFPVAEMVATAGALVEEEPELLSPIPGRVIPNAVRMAAEASGVTSSSTAYTVAHALCAVPYVWSDGVPNVSEMPDKINMHEGDVASPQGRMTTMTQLIPITDAELDFYQGRGPQELMQLLAEKDADLRDWCRESVVG
ncbi:MAG: suppressor of fused domain protein [Corynebacterium sp.]|uniref:suppressor of fused domain protein n=1 Tax=Corynebacterium sp. TaxID=1720 RepID=UPI0026DB9FE8|nr:suppressor of fused domain protein [Corynebacterium sp.]MDO5030931.1 suppressor of fused domain protein [Corynebacterium sp.]